MKPFGIELLLLVTFLFSFYSLGNDQNLPFHPDGTAFASSANPAPTVRSAGGVPFASMRQHTLAAGTLVTIELKDNLSSRNARTGDEFGAWLAAPLMVDDTLVIDRGAAVVGRVESIQAVANTRSVGHSSGYFRLTLSSISLGAGQIAIQTSSLFARGTPQHSGLSNAKASEGVARIQIPRGRRLTFRLADAVTWNDATSSSTSVHLQARP